eukprot:360899-Chlamydomonas_euryale.AAC.2
MHRHIHAGSAPCNSDSGASGICSCNAYNAVCNSHGTGPPTSAASVAARTGASCAAWMETYR